LKTVATDDNHSAKGLEFKLVFLVVWKRAYFRHSSLLMSARLEEAADYVMSVYPGHAAT